MKEQIDNKILEGKRLINLEINIKRTIKIEGGVQIGKNIESIINISKDNPMYKVTFTTKDSLNINNIDDFVFVDDYCITDEINAYNQSDKKTISKKKISDNLYITIIP